MIWYIWYILILFDIYICHLFRGRVPDAPEPKFASLRGSHAMANESNVSDVSVKGSSPCDGKLLEQDTDVATLGVQK